MRLKSIRLAGFKSFVDPTTVHLSTNLTAVVGPNGCGKSNVIDAVRWVMGESSARHLRGESMADVIFNGSTVRKPVAQATIELVFDNADASLGGEYAAYAEIAIRRLVNRDGRSDYFLNGARCRRKDITDIFLGTGLGPRSYAIIEQGMISRLIEARPEELRVYIEEAAGISRYKDRRRETETRMRHTRENLDRLQDVRSELVRQLEHLERQAQAAEKYRLYKDEELKLRAQLLTLRWQQLEQVHQSAAQQAQTLEVELAAESASWQHAETQWESLQEETRVGRQGVQDAQQQFYQVGAELNRMEQLRAHHAERLHRLELDLEEWQMQQQQAQLRYDHDVLERTQIEQALQVGAPEQERLQILWEQAQEVQESAESAMAQWQGGWEQFLAQTALHRQQAEVQQSRLQQLEQSLKRSADRLQRLRQEHGVLQAPGVNVESELELLAAHIQQTQDDLQQMEDAAQGAGAQLHELGQEYRQLQQQMDALKLQLRKIQGRLSALESLQQAALGYSEAQLRWLKKQGWAHYAALAVQLRVNSGWIQAVEVVLAHRLQALLTSGTVDLSVTELPPVVCSLLEPLEVEPLEVGCVHRIQRTEDALAQQVQPEWVHPWLVGARCVNSLEEGMRRRQDLAQTEFWVTSQGIMLGINWVQFPGQADPGSGVLERQKAIHVLEQEMAGVQEQLVILDGHTQELQDRRMVLEQQHERARQRQMELSRQQAQQSAELNGRKMRHEQFLARQERIVQEITEVESQRHEDIQIYDSVRVDLDSALAYMETDAAVQQDWQWSKNENRSAVDQARLNVRRQQEALQQVVRQLEQAEVRRQSCSETLNRSQEALLQLQVRHSRLLTAYGALGQEPVPGDSELQQVLERRLQAEQFLVRTQEVLKEQDHRIRQLEGVMQRATVRKEAVHQELAAQRLLAQDSISRQTALLEQLQEMGQTIESQREHLEATATEALWQERLEKVQLRIQRLGAVNLAAIDEYAGLQQRKVWLDAQFTDLEQALATLEQAIRTIDRETRTLFRETFERVNDGFKQLFPKVFGGGQAWLELIGEDVLESGVAIMARPPGKRNSTIHLLSGGEKALTALSLVFSIFSLNPAPFCMLDEVDAPLDDANVGRFARLVEEMSQQVQFIYITHNKIAMEMAQQLMGVTMQEPGVSRLVSVDLEEAARMADV